MRRGPLFRWAAACLACWGVLLQALLPLALAPMAASGGGALPAWALGSLCRADPGQAHIDRLALDPAAESTADRPGPLKARLYCPVCLGLQAAAPFVQPAMLALVLPSSPRSLPTFDRCEEEAAAAFHTPVQSRAPPVMA